MSLQDRVAQFLNWIGEVTFGRSTLTASLVGLVGGTVAIHGLVYWYAVGGPPPSPGSLRGWNLVAAAVHACMVLVAYSSTAKVPEVGSELSVPNLTRGGTVKALNDGVVELEDILLSSSAYITPGATDALGSLQILEMTLTLDFPGTAEKASIRALKVPTDVYSLPDDIVTDAGQAFFGNRNASYDSVTTRTTPLLVLMDAAFEAELMDLLPTGEDDCAPFGIWYGKRDPILALLQAPLPLIEGEGLLSTKRVNVSGRQNGESAAQEAQLLWFKTMESRTGYEKLFSESGGGLNDPEASHTCSLSTRVEIPKDWKIRALVPRNESLRDFYTDYQVDLLPAWVTQRFTTGLFSALTVCAHLYLASAAWYTESVLVAGRQPVRWLEYTVTSGIMMTNVSNATGAVRFGTVAAIFLSTAVTNLFGLAIEYVSSPVMKWAMYAAGYGAFFPAWIIVLVRISAFLRFFNFFKCLASSTSPIGAVDDVLGYILAGTALLLGMAYLCFPAIQAVQILVPESYARCELMFIAASMLSKTFLTVASLGLKTRPQTT